MPPTTATLRGALAAASALLLTASARPQSGPARVPPATAASAPAGGRAAQGGVQSFPFACHHDVSRQDHKLLSEEIARLEAWLARGHGQELLADPLRIERFHALAPAEGGPTPAIRWLPHWVRPDRADPGRWSLPIARINSLAVPVFAPHELLAAPAGASARLLELVPVAAFQGRDVAADLLAAWTASGSPRGSLAESAGSRVVVADGMVLDAPCDERPGSCSEVLARCRAQLDEERRLARPAAASRPTHRFLPFDLLAGWDATAGAKAAPARVAELHDVPVVMVGRLLPIDEVGLMRQFLLVREHIRRDWGRPMSLEHVVRVEMPAGRTLAWTEDPVRVSGVLRVQDQREDGFLVGVYTLAADAAERIAPGR